MLVTLMTSLPIPSENQIQFFATQQCLDCLPITNVKPDPSLEMSLFMFCSYFVESCSSFQSQKEKLVQALKELVRERERVQAFDLFE